MLHNHQSKQMSITRSESKSQLVQTASGLQQDAHILSFRLRSADWRLAANSQSLQ